MPDHCSPLPVPHMVISVCCAAKSELLLALSQTGGNPNVPIYGLVDGACGYGALDRSEWPYWRVAALGFSNPVSQSSTPQKDGCGACIEVTCQGSVRLLLLALEKVLASAPPAGKILLWRKT